MNLIQQVTADSSQQQTLILPDGSSLILQLYFSPMQYAWVFTGISWNNFTLNGLRISNSPNMLRQWKNELTWGIACYSSSNREPSQQQDFSSGASNLYILSETEVEQYEQLLSGVEFWVDTETYTDGFLVTYQGTIYVSLIDSNVGNIPSSSPLAWAVYL